MTHLDLQHSAHETHVKLNQLNQLASSVNNQQVLHAFTKLQHLTIDSRVRKCAQELQDTKLLAKLAP